MEKIIGFGTSDIEYESSKHTVSHVMRIKPKRLRKIKSQCTLNQNYLTHGYQTVVSFEMSDECTQNYNRVFISNSFTAKDDKDVSWKLIVRKNDGPSSEKELMVILELESNPANIRLFFYAKASLELNGPFSEKPPSEPYTVQTDGCTCTNWTDDPKVRAVLNIFQLNKDEAERGFRVDLTYVKMKGWQKKLSNPLPALEHTTVTTPFNVEFLLENPVASDLTLKSNDKKWKLHKCILAARSKVFAVMFTADMKEKMADLLEIDYVDPKALDVMIKYIYTGRTEGLEDVGLQVLYLSDLYDLPELKSYCEALLISKLNSGNCLSLFVNSGKWSSKLREAAKKQVCGHLSEICKTNEWKEFIQKEYDLSVEIISSLNSTL